MKKDDLIKVIIIFALLYLLNRLVVFIGASNGFFEGDILLMIAILVIACCFTATSGEGINISLKRDK